MCWEQSHRQRTIAASRSDDNRDESQEKRDNSKLPTNLPRPTKRNRPVGHTLPLRTNPGENRFGLTSSFRNGHLGHQFGRLTKRQLSQLEEIAEIQALNEIGNEGRQALQRCYLVDG